MIEDSQLQDLKNLVAEFANERWNLHENKIDDATQKWVIYQVGFDALSNKRLKLLVDAIALLPELIAAAELLKTAASAPQEPDASIQKLIDKAIKKHEEMKHK